MEFKESLKNGAIGEHVVWNMFSKMNNVRSIVDVRDDKYFQDNDVDFLIEQTNRQFTWVEVKTDFSAHKTGNLVYELTTSGNLGCFEKSKAKYIVYYLPATETAYLVNLKALRTYIYTTRPKIMKMGDAAEGFLLPIRDLERENIIEQKFEGVK